MSNWKASDLRNAGDLTPPTEAWSQHKQEWLPSSPPDVLDSAPKLSMESPALLFAISGLLAKHNEQLQKALQAHESRIVQAIENVKCPAKLLKMASRADNGASTQSKPEKLAWTLPNSLEEDGVPFLPLPDQQAPELTRMEDVSETCSSASNASHPRFKSEISSRSGKSNSEVKGMLPEYMLGRKSVRQAKQIRESISSVGGLPYEVQNFLASKLAEALVTIAIFLNAVNIGIESDWTIKHVNDDSPKIFQVANTCFSVFFTVELLLRIFAYRADFFSFKGRDFSWNMFDSFLVISSIVDDAISLFVSAPNLSVIRVLRVFRLVRVIRVVRVLRFFQDLRFIVAGIAGSMKSMLWAIALLFMMMFLVSVCFIQVTAFELDRMESDQRETVLSFYGSLFLSIYTLYQSITSGVDWGDAAKPLLDMSWLLALLFSFYIAFSVLCVLNIITGVFVDNASHISIADEEQLVIDGFENRVKWFEEVKKLFRSMAGDSDCLDIHSFHEFLDDIKVQACFQSLGVDVHESSKGGLFQLLDFDDTGKVDLDEFALGLQMLNGHAKSIDLARIRYDLKKMMRHILKLNKAQSPAHSLPVGTATGWTLPFSPRTATSED